MTAVEEMLKKEGVRFRKYARKKRRESLKKFTAIIAAIERGEPIRFVVETTQQL